MDEKIRICGEVTPSHEVSFLCIKGALGCKSNGEAFEQMIERLHPVVLKELAARKGAARGKA